MNRQIAAAIMALAAASPAYAFHFSPADTTVKMTGPFGVAVGGVLRECFINATIKTSADGQRAKMSAFSTTTENCTITATGLPWGLKAASLSKVKVVGFDYTTPDQVCGPTQAAAAVDGSGIWSLKNRFEGPEGLCVIKGSWTSTPALTVVP